MLPSTSTKICNGECLVGWRRLGWHSEQCVGVRDGRAVQTRPLNSVVFIPSVSFLRPCLRCLSIPVTILMVQTVSMNPQSTLVETRLGIRLGTIGGWGQLDLVMESVGDAILARDIEAQD